MPELQGVRGTSLLAYYHALEKINTRQRECLLALERLKQANNRMISEESSLPINVVTPRMGELRKLGLVKESKIDIDKVTGRKTIFFERVKK